MLVQIEEGLLASAVAAGQESRRSAAEQLAHWVRVGRDHEAAASAAPALVGRALAGELVYDDLPESAQVVVRAAWDALVEQRIAELDFEPEFKAKWMSWVEADREGNGVLRGPPFA